MRESFDAYRYFEYMRRRWRFLALAAGVAGVAALIVTLFLPKRYTATASVVIDPPGGNDPRTATAVSPIYLESLRSYEYFASSDSLFDRAMDHFHLRPAGDKRAIESWKRQVLKVAKIHDTKILELSVTLPDPRQAQALVQYLAEETVNLSRSLNNDADREALDRAQQQLDAASSGRAKVASEWQQFSAREPVEALQAALDTTVELQSRVQRQLLEANADIIDYETREKSLGAAKDVARGRELENVRGELAALRARAAALAKQEQQLDREVAAKSSELGQRSARRDELKSRLGHALTAYEAATKQLDDVRANLGHRGERLQIIDPGIVPQRPSSPNLPLNVISAILLGWLAAAVYLSVTFSFSEQRREALSERYHVQRQVS